MSFDKLLEELQERREKALLMGGVEKIGLQHTRGRLTARERIKRVLDPSSFTELGLLACSDMPGMEEKTPADGIIIGYGSLNGRPVGVISSDFTVLASTLARVNGKKIHDFKQQITRKKFPLIFFGEGGGGRVPDGQGSIGMTASAMMGERAIFPMYLHLREAPMVTAIAGNCYGVPMWQACASDFVVQVKGSTLAVAGARALQKAIGASYTDEEMGGWKVHAEATGIVDRVAEDEKECFAIIKEFLDYMPSHNGELPPAKEIPDGSGKNMEKILDILPEKRTRGYNMYKIIKTIVDGGTIFDIKPLFGKTVITCLVRIGGRAVGCIASQPMINGGAMDTDALDKMTSFMCLCDSFNIPLLFLHDTPGFLVGKEAELKKVGAKVTNAMGALAQVTVPKISIVIRKSYGQAAANMCGPGTGPDFMAAWPTGESGFVDPVVAANIAFGSFPDEERKRLTEQMIKDTDIYPLAQGFYLHDIIDPRDTRNIIIKMLDIVGNSQTAGIGEHRLFNWPTKF